jgi:hypothetical protein
MRRIAGFVACLALAACADMSLPTDGVPMPSFYFLPYWITGLPETSPEFGVSGVQGPLPPAYADFNNTSQDVDATHAKTICTLGYEKTGEQVMTAEPGQFTEWRVRCNPYAPTF